VCDPNAVAYGLAFAFGYTDTYCDANTYAKRNAESHTDSYSKGNTKAATDPASASVRRRSKV